ncbi:unnamed protein product [Ambrosiozyma monospora]|uniref:Unnamed protein product n=1 Tax=Ambrosiozyma monospora TaxID=43982 RepID=A0ACB5T1X7_AMBMO|nr:unnamed protein product [Ambrosiozyma monospora]
MEEAVAQIYTTKNLGAQFYIDNFNNATKYEIDSTSITNKNSPIYSPTLPNMTYAKGYASELNVFYENYDNATYFGAGLCVYFAVVMLLGTIFTFLINVGASQKFVHPIVSYLRAYIIIPTMFSKGRNAQPMGGFKVFTGLFPDRVDSLICLGYTVLHIVFWAYPYHSSPAHTYTWTSQLEEIRRLVGDRSGIMAFGEIPLLILFGGRNNLLTFMTGFKYTSMIHFHKLVSRFMIIDALIHSVNYVLLFEQYWARALKTLYFVCGIAATTLAVAIWLFSFHPIRSRMYETFLYFHIIMVAGFVSMCWYHCRDMGFCEWIIAASVFWVFDRVVRVIRMSFFGYRTANLTLINDETFKVSVKRPKTYISSPGQYGFVYFADALLWFQSHPFTVYNDGENLVLYIKVKRGITKKIHNKLVANGGKMTKKLCIEGPYGESSPVGKYQNALLLTGGSGVPGIINHALTLSAKTKPQNIKFIWVYKTIKDLNFYFEDFLAKLKDSRVIVDIYLTRETSLEGAYLGTSTSTFGSSDEASYKDKHKAKEHTSFGQLPSFINFKLGKPNMEQLIKEEVESFGGGSVGIVACGPPVMMDHLKHAVSKEVVSYKDRIDYFDEFQTW